MPIYDGQNAKTQVKQIPYGNAGIRISVSHIISIIQQYRKNTDIRTFALRLIHECPPKDYLCEARTIFGWMQQNIRFTRDVHHVETLMTPDITLYERAGDCDDQVILLNSLLQSIGIPTRLVLVASRRDAPKEFNHILTEAYLPVNGKSKWVAMETTPITASGQFAPFGYLPKGITYERREIA